jgi:hypothetical protein
LKSRSWLLLMRTAGAKVGSAWVMPSGSQKETIAADF